MYKLLLIITLFLAFPPIDSRADNVEPSRSSPCELNKNFISDNPPFKTLDNEEFVPVRELIEDASHIIIWDALTSKVLVSYDGLELIFTNNSSLISINGSPYQLSLSPYIKKGTLYVPTNETYSFIATYLLETQKDKVFFPDVSSISMFGSPGCNASFPLFFSIEMMLKVL